MVIVKIWGGLGNQMFQYALYLSYKSKGVSTRLDKTFYKKIKEHNGYELERIFNIHPEYSSGISKMFIKTRGKLLSKLVKSPYKESDAMAGCYISSVVSLKSGYIKGFWQTEKYFTSIADTVREEFSFPELTDEKNISILNEIQKSNSVSIHIRRGDFLLQNRNWAININFYKNAIQFIQQKIAHPVFFIFSDDMSWVKENLQLPNSFFIDWNKGENSYKDMQLMSACQHNIIANSSFSWWGAWLNNNKEKIVLVPEKWIPTMEGTRDIIPGDWIKISNE